MLALELRVQRGALAVEVALEVAAGECVALAGPSGAGKTTVLRAVAGLLEPDDGFVRCGDEVWFDRGLGVSVPAERRRCGVVFQDYALFPHLSARDNVAYGLRELSRGARRARADALLAQFGIEARADARPAQLSGGERQRVALARALAREPMALLLDEPMSALDARTRAGATRELAALLAQIGVPVLLITHDFLEAALLGDRVAVLDEGRVVQEGSASDLAGVPQSAFVADFTGASVLTGQASPGAGGLTQVAVDGGGELVSVDDATGAVAACVHPWDVVLEPAGAAAAGSAQNHLAVDVVAVTAIGNRVRVTLATPQPLVAEVTAAAVDSLELRPGARVTATFKAAATRLVAR